MRISLGFLFSFFLYFLIYESSSQGINPLEKTGRTFPQKEINRFFSTASYPIQSNFLLEKKNFSNADQEHSVSGMLQAISKNNILRNGFLYSPDTVSVGDTLVVGYTLNDTLRISGNWTHVGPVIVLGNGVLIFTNATVTLVGDIIVLGYGKIFSNSSSFFIPQQYWYQRSILVVQNGYLNIAGTTFNYGGYPHGFTATDSAKVFLTNITNNDYTTTGISKNASITINGNNLTGEFIISDRTFLSLKHVANALLWHQFPDTAVINHTFPNGSTVNTYLFNKNTPGVRGIEYTVKVDTSTNIQWAMMPTNGSDITISNSTIRSIGVWFEGKDTSNVSGLVNNSNYSNFTAPLPDRNLHFINTSVQTWSIYLFDTTVVNVSGCILGEVGSFGRSKFQGTNYFVDGSGGYCFASDTSFMMNGFSSVSSNVRSERSAIDMFAYSTQSNGVATAIGTSVLIVVQSTLTQDPVPYEKSCVWLANIMQPSSAYVDSTVSVVGSAWIDKTSISPWMDFGKSRVWFRITGATTWSAVNNFNTVEIRNNTLAVWNTHGLVPGSYDLRLVLFDNWGDSVEAIKSVNLLPAILVHTEELTSESSISIFPNPCNGKFTVESLQLKVQDLQIQNVLGEIIYTMSPSLRGSGGGISVDLSGQPGGVYLLRLRTDDQFLTKKIVIRH